MGVLYVCSVSVSENEAVGTTLLHLTATDDDHTYDNTKLEFSIISGHSSSSGTDIDDDGRRHFSMTESTGELILVSSLDRETSDRYMLQMTASDRGQPSLTTTTTVSITLFQSINRSELHYYYNHWTVIATVFLYWNLKVF